MIMTIAQRELRSLFLSPVAWSVLAVQQFILGWIFLRVVERFTGLEAAKRVAGISLELTLNVFSFAALLSLFSIPLLAMRLFSEEQRSGAYRLLRSAPVSLGEILLGKYLGLCVLLLTVSLLPLLMGLSLTIGTDPDLGLIASAFVGLMMLNLCFAAVAIFASTLTSQPAAAAVAGYGILLLLSVVSQTRDLAENDYVGFFQWLSWNEHLLPFLLGMVRTSDLVYFLGTTALFLLLALRQLENRDLG